MKGDNIFHDIPYKITDPFHFCLNSYPSSIRTLDFLIPIVGGLSPNFVIMNNDLHHNKITKACNYLDMNNLILEN